MMSGDKNGTTEFTLIMKNTFDLFPTPLYWKSADPVTKHALLKEFDSKKQYIDDNLDLFEQYEYSQPRKTDEYKQKRACETYNLTVAKAFIDKCVEEFCIELGYNNLKVHCQRMWFNRVDQHDSHVWHSHGNALVSGTLYFVVPSGDIEFKTPNPFAKARMFPIKNEWCPVVSRTPEPGDIGLWPSYLEHRVTENTTDQSRYAMSFDYVDKNI